MLDALIIGAGPSGLSAAILLIQRGLKVKVVEQREGVGRHSRAIGIHPPGLEVLDAVGIGQQVAAQAVHIRDGVGISGTRSIGRMDFSRIGGRYGYIASLPQNETIKLLRQRLRELAPHALEEETRYLSHRVTPDGAAVQVSVQRGAGREEHSQRYTARWLIGADGTNSAVRTQLGIGFVGRDLPDEYVMGDYPDTTSFGSTAALFLHPHGIVESFPLPGELRRWVAHRGRGTDRVRGLAELVSARTGEQLAEEQRTMYSEFSTANRQVPTMVHERTVLIGDAAHEVSPIGGQGMTLGLLDAAELAEILPASAPALRWSEFDRRRLAAARKAGGQARLNMWLGRPLPVWMVPARDLMLRSVVGSERINVAAARTFTMSSATQRTDW